MLGVHWQIGRPERWQAYDSEVARLKWFVPLVVGSRYPENSRNEIEEKTARSDSDLALNKIDYPSNYLGTQASGRARSTKYYVN